MDNILFVFNLIVFVCLSFVFCKNALHMFQQQHYETYRYSKWLFNKNNAKFSISVIYCFLVLLLSFFLKGLIEYILVMLISISFAILFIYSEIKKEYIKPIVLTNRVKRQIIVMALLDILFIYLSLSLFPIGVVGVLAITLPYLLIYPLAYITLPVEELIKKQYENEAREKLASLDELCKIGVTGSYGKTTTKNVINDIISQTFLTYMTPASYNTPMGITRSIREDLKPIYEVFVCEMGADKVGDISYLMDFVKPKIGVVTSIGPQHLNTFLKLENIIQEKMQEIEMLPSDGVGIINLDNEYIAKYKIKNKCKIVSVGINNKKADYVAKDIKYTKNGSSFTLKINNKNYKFTTALLGQHNVTNVLIGIAIALELGIDVKKIVKAVANVSQVTHRLEVKRINGFTFIDDSFNANPVGSKMSLDVLSLMPGKRVIVTPGMIDLGVKENDANKEFGRYMKGKADYVILVGERQTKAIRMGLEESNFNMNNVYVLKTVKQAFDLIYSKFTNKDTILLENDLPDAFNV